MRSRTDLKYIFYTSENWIMDFELDPNVSI